METNPWGLDDLELDVLVGVVGGLSNRGIAAFLKLSETSVDIQVQRIQNKMLPKTALSSKDWDKRALLVRKVYREAKGSLLKKMC
jgi:DNA-binding NarL/FixJ family response regulator